MAEQKQKSQAERAASSNKKSNSRSKTTVSKSNKTTTVTKKVEKTNIPPRLISASVCMILFILFVVAQMWPAGTLVQMLADLVRGLVGQAGFIVATPVLLYIFCIHAFSGKRPVVMRTICLVGFIVVCGCFYHYLEDPSVKQLVTFDQLNDRTLGDFWSTGIDNTSGGIICGGIAVLLGCLLGPIIPVIIYVIAGIMTLLAGMQFTPAGIIRAIQNRPRPDWEEEVEEPQDPAAVVVNHIANKRIAQLERRRNAVVNEDLTPEEKKQKNVSELFKQIDGDVDIPVSVASGKNGNNEDNGPEIIPVANNNAPTPKITEEIPKEMPPLSIADIIVDTETGEIVETPDPAPEPEIQKPAKKISAKEVEEAVSDVAKEILEAETANKIEYSYPPIDLLKLPSGSVGDGAMEMRDNTRRLNETLASFKIEARIINVTRGPSVTRYEVELEKGVRLNKLTTAADDIALNLGATGVRIAAIPGKISVVGIEVPNRAVTMVSLREVIDSNTFFDAKSKASFAVGKDIGGSCIVGNIAKLPHMLIAGTTGSGKSVCMNSIIISLLYKATPEEVKLIMVDPKMVELGIYNGIPHLLIPVVTDPKKAAGSLQWAVAEMMRRYKAMSDAGVRDLESYNAIMDSEENAAAKLPQVVVIIDELADLMLVAAKEVEESICRIAQMGRAAGIHLIIATQRPSADVITGLMKANIPSRIAFSVASAMESRIILDTQGAEKLVGKGDMLYAPIGDGKPRRVQGCFVSDSEVEAVATYVKKNSSTEYDQQVIEEIDRKAAQTGNKNSAASNDFEPSAEETGGDEMLPAAVDVILETGQASVSMLQRRLKLGYARAARIVDEMEERGYVGPFAGSKPREIIITKEEWEASKKGSSQMAFDDIVDTEE